MSKDLIMGKAKVLKRDDASQPINGFCVNPSLTAPTYSNGVALASTAEIAFNAAEWMAARFYCTQAMEVMVTSEDTPAVTSKFLEPANTANIYLLVDIVGLTIKNVSASAATLYIQAM